MIEINPKIIALTLVAVTLVSVTVVLVLPSKPVQLPTMSAIPDSDQDGVPDDQDLVVNGNAGVAISVHDFSAVGACGNWLPLLNPRCQPTFQLEIDTNSDGTTDRTRTVEFTDANEVPVVLDVVADVPDQATRIRLLLTVTDRDGNDAVDYWSAGHSTFGWIEVPLTLGPQTMPFSGTGSASASVVVSLSVARYP